MKHIISTAAALALTCALGLGQAAAADRPKVNIAFPTAATTGALYPLGAGIANLWNTKLPYVTARAQASNGGIQNLNLLKAGDAAGFLCCFQHYL